MTQKQKREEERVSQQREDLLHFGVTSMLKNPTKNKQIEPLEMEMRISKTLRLSALKW